MDVREWLNNNKTNLLSQLPYIGVSFSLHHPPKSPEWQLRWSDDLFTYQTVTSYSSRDAAQQALREVQEWFKEVFGAVLECKRKGNSLSIQIPFTPQTKSQKPKSSKKKQSLTYNEFLSILARQFAPDQFIRDHIHNFRPVLNENPIIFVVENPNTSHIPANHLRCALCNKPLREFSHALHILTKKGQKIFVDVFNSADCINICLNAIQYYLQKSFNITSNILFPY